MYTNARFQLIGRAALGPNLPETNMNDKKFEKIKKSTYMPNFSQFEELHILGPNLPKKNMNEKHFEKIKNIPAEISIYNVPLDQISFNLANF